MPSMIPYQIDYSVKNAAKTIGFSKKRVTFKFGFASPSALAEGLQGPGCRGSEHELTFVWSLATGKRQLILDSKDLHFSESGQNGWTADRVWQYAFSVRDAATGQSYKALFVSQAATNPRDNTPQHPFDLRIAGLSYFKFNALYQLGTPTMIVHRDTGREGGYNRSAGRDSPLTSEERREIAMAKLASIQDIARREAEEVERKAALLLEQSKGSNKDSNPPPMKHEEASLISFDDDPPMVPPPPASMPVGAPPTQQPVSSVGGPNYPYYASSVTLDPMFDTASPGALTQPAPSASMYGNNPYGAPPPQASSGSLTGSFYGSANPPSSSFPYSTNPYAAPPPTQAPSPYGISSPSADSSSQALTPYYGSGTAGSTQQQPQAYIDSTGRYAVGQPAPTTTSYNVSTPSSGFYDTSGTSTYSANNNFSSSNLASPGAVSYGSAPSFAQPPMQQQPPQSAASSFAAVPPYGSNPPTSYNPYAAPPPSSTAPYYQQQPSTAQSYTY